MVMVIMGVASLVKKANWSKSMEKKIPAFDRLIILDCWLITVPRFEWMSCHVIDA